MSLGTEDLQQDIERIMGQGAARDIEVRDGIVDWNVADVGEFASTVFQLTQER